MSRIKIKQGGEYMVYEEWQSYIKWPGKNSLKRWHHVEISREWWSKPWIHLVDDNIKQQVQQVQRPWGRIQLENIMEGKFHSQKKYKKKDQIPKKKTPKGVCRIYTKKTLTLQWEMKEDLSKWAGYPPGSPREGGQLWMLWNKKIITELDLTELWQELRQ